MDPFFVRGGGGRGDVGFFKGNCIVDSLCKQYTSVIQNYDMPVTRRFGQRPC